jgi:hypothetical protein
MLPYQIYQALMDEHVHDLRAAALRHERAAEARLAADRTRRSSPLSEAVRHLKSLAHVSLSAHVRLSPRAGSTTTGSTATGSPQTGLSATGSTSSGSTAGPLGCIA